MACPLFRMKSYKDLNQLQCKVSLNSTFRKSPITTKGFQSEAFCKMFITQNDYKLNTLSNNKRAPLSKCIPIFSKNTRLSFTTKTNEKAASKLRENVVIKGAKIVFHKAYAFTTWSGSLVLISVGAVAAFVIFYNLYDEMTSKNSPLRYYEESVNLIKENPKILRYFGPGMTAHGDPRSTRRHSRKPSIHYFWDKDGRRHAMMKYFLEGDKDHDLEGKVTLHMVDYSPIPQTSDSNSIWKYKGLTVETVGWPSRKITVKGDETRFGGTW
ncbi:Mitochondrial import inner membrane translocase subunit Tim21 [Entomophthora muscae]|uniref:Mitochondrial import inner membrane translocase subunit Tim21 n=1 Tax=Entomophthora muscae TaxID=34485 RepID=A0ACC2TXU0_9FUNG|nr:Mitochondrial import inner membrane translocase subunit Tim21 [Entomophthora muscae]